MIFNSQKSTQFLVYKILLSGHSQMLHRLDNTSPFSNGALVCINYGRTLLLTIASYSDVAKPGPIQALARASPHLALASKMLKAHDSFSQTVLLSTYCIFNESLHRYIDNDVYMCIK